MSDNVQPVGNNRFLGLKSVIEKRKDREKANKPSKKKKQNQEEDNQEEKADLNDELGNEGPIKNGNGSLIDLEI